MFEEVNTDFVRIILMCLGMKFGINLAFLFVSSTILL